MRITAGLTVFVAAVTWDGEDGSVTCASPTQAVTTDTVWTNSIVSATRAGAAFSVIRVSLTSSYPSLIPTHVSEGRKCGARAVSA